ncbi:MAG: WD40 repeat domain-containing serine/threonine protein kinase [Planctomycetales bacterium]
MSAVTVNQFLELLHGSNLHSAEQWADIERAVAKIAAAGLGSLSVERLAQGLVDRGWLTRWQADLLLLGRHRFFLGKYRLLEAIGAGGMGAVYKAHHERMGRIVALKVMSPATVNNDKAVARFQQEMQLVAAVNHPHIVAAYDADCVDQTHFLVMEYVEGHDLGWYLNQRGALPVSWVCECIRQGALGLQHAHEQGLVHRDVKPSNLLVAHDADSGRPLVKLLDLGLARFASQAESASDAPEGTPPASSVSSDRGLTVAGQILGTPDYMAPEQAADIRQANPRSDLFSLGCTLFRLLTGQVPFPHRSPTGELGTGPEDAPRSLRELRPDAPRELEAVVLKMIARNPQERYASAGEVAAALVPFASTATQPTLAASPPAASPAAHRSLRHLDQSLAQFLDHLATEADDGLSVHAEFLRRHHSWVRRALLAGALLLCVVLVGLFVWRLTGEATLVLDWGETPRARDRLEVNDRLIAVRDDGPLQIHASPGRWTLRAEREGFESIQEQLELTRAETRQLALRWVPTSATIRGEKLEKLRQRLAELGEQPPTSRRLGRLRNDMLRFRRQYAGTDESATVAQLLTQLPSPFDLFSLSTPEERQRLKGIASAQGVQSPNVVAIVGSGRGRFWNRVDSTAVSGDGRWIAAASRDGTVRVFDRQDAKQRHVWHLSRVPRHVAYSPTEDLLAVADEGSQVSLWSGFEAAPRQVFNDAQGPLSFSPDGKLLVFRNAAFEHVVYDLEMNLQRWGLPGRSEAGARPAVFSPDGSLLALGDPEGNLRLWDLDQGEWKTTLSRGGEPLGFTSEGGTLVSARNGRVMLWEIANGTGRLTNIDVPTLSLLSPDGNTLAAVHRREGELRFWNLSDSTSRPVVEAFAPATALAFSRDSQMLVTGGADFCIRQWEVATGIEHPPVSPSWEGLALSPDRQVAAIGRGDTVKLWNLLRPRGSIQSLQDPARELRQLLWSPDGRWIVGITQTSSPSPIPWWTAQGGDLRQTPAIPLQEFQLGTFSPRGHLLAAAGRARDIHWWSVHDGTSQPALDTFPDQPTALAFDPQERWLAVACRDGSVILHDLQTQQRRSLSAESPEVCTALAFSWDGRFLIGATEKGVVVWEVSSGEVVQRLDCQPGSPTCLSLSETGERLAVSGATGKVWIWNRSQSGIPESTPAHTETIGPAGGIIRQVAWAPDGRHLLTVNGNSTLYVLRLGQDANGASPRTSDDGQ